MIFFVRPSLLPGPGQSFFSEVLISPVTPMCPFSYWSHSAVSSHCMQNDISSNQSGNHANQYPPVFIIVRLSGLGLSQMEIASITSARVSMVHLSGRLERYPSATNRLWTIWTITRRSIRLIRSTPILDAERNLSPPWCSRIQSMSA